MSGEGDRAIRIAKDTFEQTSLVPLSIQYVGSVARWHTLLRENGVALEGQDSILDTMWNERTSYDLFDQAEMTAARISLLRQSRPNDCRREGEELASLLARLPLAVESQLKRLAVIA
jgi:hypothetical protein